MLTTVKGKLLSPIFRASVGQGSQRWINLHEYQSKLLLDKFGVSTQVGSVANSPSEAKNGAKKLLDDGVKTVVLKAQVFAGGRGKGTLSSGLVGGVQFVENADKAEKIASKMLGYCLRTHQTDDKGLMVHKLLLTEGVNIEREYYLAFILDRSKGGPVIVASQQGGIDIEEVAKTKPEAIKVIPVDILEGLSEDNIDAVCKTLLGDGANFKPEVFESLTSQLKNIVSNLYRLLHEKDASQIEINPLAVTDDGRVLCVDAKLNFDDSAAFRQKDIFAMEDKELRCPRELGAEEMGMNWISMDGNIGCLVNGAGLAMATMDLITVNGGTPANFLDLGGGATQEQVQRSFELLTSDPNVKAIFVNIFGGITRCDVVAKGIIEAAKALNMKVPLVVRLVGNNAEQARELLNNSGLKIAYVQDFAEAAKKAVAMSTA